MKVNIANYVYHDLSKHFSPQNDKIVDSDLMDMLITKWSNDEFLACDSNLKLKHKQKIQPPQLM